MKTKEKTASVRARIEPTIKIRAEKVLHTLGISSSEAINVFYRKIIAEQGIPFSLHIPNKETRATIAAARRGKQIESFGSIAVWKKQFSQK